MRGGQDEHRLDSLRDRDGPHVDYETGHETREHQREHETNADAGREDDDGFTQKGCCKIARRCPPRPARMANSRLLNASM